MEIEKEPEIKGDMEVESEENKSNQNEKQTANEAP